MTIQMIDKAQAAARKHFARKQALEVESAKQIVKALDGSRDGSRVRVRFTADSNSATVSIDVKGPVRV